MSRVEELEFSIGVANMRGFICEFNKRVGVQNCTVIAEVKQHECWLITGCLKIHSLVGVR